MTIGLYTLANTPVDATAPLRLSIGRLIKSQPASKWAEQVRGTAAVPAIYTEAQLQAVGYRLPTLDDARAAAYRDLDAARLNAERQGVYVDLALPAGAAVWNYAGNPPESQMRVTGVLSAARSAVAAGSPDAVGFAARSIADAQAGIPAANQVHTIAQLEAIEAAWQARLEDIGDLVGSAVQQLRLAQSEAQVAMELGLAQQAMADLAAPPASAA